MSILHTGRHVKIHPCVALTAWAACHQTIALWMACACGNAGHTLPGASGLQDVSTHMHKHMLCPCTISGGGPSRRWWQRRSAIWLSRHQSRHLSTCTCVQIRFADAQEAEAGSQALVAAQECELARLTREAAQQRAFMQTRVTETQVSCTADAGHSCGAVFCHARAQPIPPRADQGSSPAARLHVDACHGDAGELHCTDAGHGCDAVHCNVRAQLVPPQTDQGSRPAACSFMQMRVTETQVSCSPDAGHGCAAVMCTHESPGSWSIHHRLKLSSHGGRPAAC